MKRRIRLTESDLHRIVNMSVKRVLGEGQGWNTFKDAVREVNDFDDDEWDDFNKRMSDPENRADFDKKKKNFIKYGDWEDYDDEDDSDLPLYYDERGMARNRPGKTVRIKE